MHCPYCNTEYNDERPCFCQPPAKEKRSAREEYYAQSSAQEPVCVNSHRGIRLE